MIAKVAIVRLSEFEPKSLLTAKLDGAAEQYFARKMTRSEARLKTDLLKASSNVPSQVDLRSAYPGASKVLEAPFGYKPNQFGEFHTAALDRGYFFGLLNAFTAVTVATKIDELRAHPERDLLLPADFTAECTVDPAADRRAVQIGFISPYVPPLRHRDSVRKPLCEFITTHYQVIQAAQPGDYGYELWRRSSVNKGEMPFLETNERRNVLRVVGALSLPQSFQSAHLDAAIRVETSVDAHQDPNVTDPSSITGIALDAGEPLLSRHRILQALPVGLDGSPQGPKSSCLSVPKESRRVKLRRDE